MLHRFHAFQSLDLTQKRKNRNYPVFRYYYLSKRFAVNTEKKSFTLHNRPFYKKNFPYFPFFSSLRNRKLEPRLRATDGHCVLMSGICVRVYVYVCARELPFFSEFMCVDVCTCVCVCVSFRSIFLFFFLFSFFSFFSFFFLQSTLLRGSVTFERSVDIFFLLHAFISTSGDDRTAGIASTTNARKTL